MEYLHNRNCKKLTGYTYNDILALTGIFGIHSPEELKSKAVSYFQADIDGKSVSIEYETTLLKEFIIRLDLNTKTIKDEKFVSSGVKEGIGFGWLVSQIDTAVRLGFKKISIDAYGDYTMYEQFSGYIVWGKYGFLMSSKKDIRDFHQKMKQLHEEGIIAEEYKTLHALLSAKGGVDIWRENGKDWLGEFNLSPRSQSMRIFNKVRKQKGL